MNQFIEGIFNDKKTAFGIGCSIMALCLGAYILLSYESKPANLNETLQQLCREVPKEFHKEADNPLFSKSTSAVFDYVYSTSLSYEQIRDYYSNRLLPEQWGIHESSWYNKSSNDKYGTLTFRKGKFKIEIGQIKESNTELKKLRFNLTCSWHSV